MYVDIFLSFCVRKGEKRANKAVVIYSKNATTADRVEAFIKW